MKKKLLLLVLPLLLAATTVFAMDYNEALKIAKKDNKPVLLYFFNNSCYYCTLMDKNTLDDKEVKSILTKDFVFLRVNTEKSRDLAMLYSISGTPTSWFLDSAGKPIRPIPGYVEKADYKVLLDYVKGRHYTNTDILTYLKSVRKK
jgi:thioredoxin-related protein